MSNMTIEVEFLAGTKLEDAISEAKKKALMFEVAYVCFNFNGVNFSISKNCNEDAVLEEYKDGSSKYGIVG